MSLQKKTIIGVLWSALDRFSAQGIVFILGLILARLLSPSDYGVYGIMVIFLTISETLVQSGFSAALIQKDDRDELDYSTTFILNVTASIVFYILLYFLAPFIADYFEESMIAELLRVVAVVIIVDAFGMVQRTKLTILMNFKLLTKISLISVTLSGFVGIGLAYLGYGVWSLVYQSITLRVFQVSLLWILPRSTFEMKFSYNRFKRLFGFGSKLLVSGLLNTIYTHIYSIVIGKIFSLSDLGYYTRAQQFANFPSANIAGIVQRVTFPALSTIQQDNLKLKEFYRKIVIFSAMIVFPLMIGLAVLAESVVITLLTEKWRDSTWILQILCLAMMWYPVHAANLNVISVKGRSDVFLKLEVIKRMLVTLVLLVSIPLGFKVVVLGQVLTSCVGIFINTYYTKRIISYGLKDQLKDLTPFLLLSLLMGVIVYFCNIAIASYIWKIVCGVLVGSAFYLSALYYFNFGNVKYIRSIIKNL